MFFKNNDLSRKILIFIYKLNRDKIIFINNRIFKNYLIDNTYL